MTTKTTSVIAIPPQIAAAVLLKVLSILLHKNSPGYFVSLGGVRLIRKKSISVGR
jgi:hypothetical protein